MNIKNYLTKLICKVTLETGRHYCTKNPKLGHSGDSEEALDVTTKDVISIRKLQSLEIMNLPEGSTPFCVTKMTDGEIDDINSKTSEDIKELTDKALTLSREYYADYKACVRLVCNDPSDPYLEFNCLKSGGDVKAQWRKCIQSKKEKALQMLKEEKNIAEKDGDVLAVEEIDSLCDLIDEIDYSFVNSAQSDKEALAYWPALLLPAPKIKSP